MAPAAVSTFAKPSSSIPALISSRIELSASPPSLPGVPAE